MPKIGHVELVFETDQEKKGSWRFKESGSEVCRSLYVQKAALADLGFEPGDRLQVTIAVVSDRSVEMGDRL